MSDETPREPRVVVVEVDENGYGRVDPPVTVSAEDPVQFAVRMPSDLASRVAPCLLHGLSIGTPATEGGQDADRLIPYWDRTNMAIDAPVMPRSSGEGEQS
jgi:hypothetical protein